VCRRALDFVEIRRLSAVGRVHVAAPFGFA
jgi:hypothetical protein